MAVTAQARRRNDPERTNGPTGRMSESNVRIERRADGVIVRRKGGWGWIGEGGWITDVEPRMDTNGREFGGKMAARDERW